MSGRIPNEHLQAAARNQRPPTDSLSEKEYRSSRDIAPPTHHLPLSSPSYLSQASCKTFVKNQPTSDACAYIKDTRSNKNPGELRYIVYPSAAPCFYSRRPCRYKSSTYASEPSHYYSFSLIDH